MRVLITGSRTWQDRWAIQDRIGDLPSVATLLIGDAGGADALALKAAELYNLDFYVYHADWNTHGKKAGHVRNDKMLSLEPDLVLAFWDGTSPGTKSVIHKARRRSIPVEVIRPVR